MSETQSVVPVIDVEVWRSVCDYPDYEVSSFGSVRSHVKNRHRTLSPIGAGSYLGVDLWRNAKRRRRYVHHLVLEAFVGPRPDGTECCHGDGSKDNNRLSNLRWDTKSANSRDTIRHGRHLSRPPRGERCWRAKLTEPQVRAIRARHAAGESMTAMGREYGVTGAAIYGIVVGKSWKHLLVGDAEKAADAMGAVFGD